MVEKGMKVTAGDRITSAAYSLFLAGQNLPHIKLILYSASLLPVPMTPAKMEPPVRHNPRFITLMFSGISMRIIY